MVENLKTNEAAIISVKDELTGAFMQPQFIKGKEWKKQAIRIFQHNINNIGIWKSNPTDYSLYYIGVFNEETGEIFGIPDKIANGRSVLEEWFIVY